VPVEVAYGSDIDQVRELLLKCPVGVANIVPDPAPTMRLRELGASDVKFELLVWIHDGMQRGVVIDKLNCAIYKTFQAHHIEIPHAKYDVYIRSTTAEIARGSSARLRPDDQVEVSSARWTDSGT